MTVKELIEELNKVEDKNVDLTFMSDHTGTYWDIYDLFTDIKGECLIFIGLKENKNEIDNRYSRSGV